VIVYDPDFERWGFQEPERRDSGRSLVLVVLGFLVACVAVPLAVDWLLRALGLVRR
jgi:hypothetical protein